MPMYDLICRACNTQQIDVLQPIQCEQSLCACGAQFERAWLTKPANVIGDECDVSIRHGLCNEDGTPRRFRSKQDIKRTAKEKGWTPYVVHQGIDAGTDKSPFTSRWI